VCLQTHGGFGFAAEYDIERKFRETRLYQVAPISTNLILAYIAEHVSDCHARTELAEPSIERFSHECYSEETNSVTAQIPIASAICLDDSRIRRLRAIIAGAMTRTKNGRLQNPVGDPHRWRIDMMELVRVALRRPYTIAVFSLLILLLGALALSRMVVDFSPRSTSPLFS